MTVRRRSLLLAAGGAMAARHLDVVKRCREAGTEPVGSGAGGFGAMVRASSAKIRDPMAGGQLRPE